MLLTGKRFYQRRADGMWCVDCATCGDPLALRKGDAGAGNAPQGDLQGIAHCYQCDHATKASGVY